MYKVEGSGADTREVGGIVYWRGVHTNTHADKEQAGRQARVDRVLRVSRLTIRCVFNNVSPATQWSRCREK